MPGRIKTLFMGPGFIIRNLVISAIIISFFLMLAEAQTIEFESSHSKGRENKATVIMSLTRSTPHGGQSRVDYTVTGTATGSGVDYVLSSGTVIFESGDKTNDDIVAIIVDDLLDEPDETIIVTLSNPVNAILGDKAIYTYTIEDDDRPGDAKGIISLSCYPKETTYGETIEFCVEIAENPLPISTIGLDFVFDQTEYALLDLGVGTLSMDWSVIEGIQDSPGRIRIEAQAGSGSIIPEFSRGTLIEISLQIKCLNLSEDRESATAIENYDYDLAGAFIPGSVDAALIIKPCPVLGDANGDKRVTPGDAQTAFAIFLGQISPDFCQMSTCDTNCNGSISPGDAQSIFNHYLGRISLPECCEEAGLSSSWLTDPLSTEALNSREKRRLFPLPTVARSKDTIAVPIIITRPQGISSFSFDLIYPAETLTYLGLRKSPMTRFFEQIDGISLGEGFLRIEGESTIPIVDYRLGSLAVVLFKVNEAMPIRLQLEVLNPKGDIAEASMEEGFVTQKDDLDETSNFIGFGKAVFFADNTLKIPVLISQAYGIKAFGMDCEYSPDKLEFVGIDSAGLTEDFHVVEGNFVEGGRLRVGGFNMSPIQTNSPDIFFEMVFLIKEKGGFVRVIDLVDDIRSYSCLAPFLLID